MVNKISKIIIVIVVILTVIRVSCRSPDEGVRKIRQNNLHGVRQSDDFREYINENLNQRLNPSVRGLALAYFLGDRKELSSSTKEDISVIGITHLIVISGMHLAILVNILSRGLRFTSKFVRSYFCVLFVILYIKVVGLTPSLLRAGFVVFCQLFVGYYGRKLDKSRIIFFAIAITLLINPNYIDDLGWQLSMLAYSGILILAPLIEGFLFGKGFNKRRSIGRGKNCLVKILARINTILDIRAGFVVAIAVNMMVLPLILYKFGYFSLLSIFATLLLSPLMPMILVSVMMAGILPYGLYQCANFLIAGGIGLIEVQVEIIKILSKVQILSVNVRKNNADFLLLYFLVVILYFFLRKKNVDISKNRTDQNNQFIKGSDGMQDIDTYLVEWQKQLQLRCQQYKNKTSQTEAFDNIKKSS